MRTALLLILLGAMPLAAGDLQRYPALLKADANPDSGRATRSIRITYLGTNGYQLEADRSVLLIDPYFTRIGFGAVTLQKRIAPNQKRISEPLRRLRPGTEAILVTHGHFDHLLDVPVIMKATGARLISSASVIHSAVAAGAPSARSSAVKPGDIVTRGPWKITVLAAAHDRLFGNVPYPGEVETGATPPRQPRDWKLGVPLAFLLEANGRRIYIDSGGRPEQPPPAVGPLDLAILGTALPDSRARFAEAVRRLRPRFVLPSHQDNFFLPLERGFHFALLSDFPHVLETHRKERLPGRLILLDYFRPWTLP